MGSSVLSYRRRLGGVSGGRQCGSERVYGVAAVLAIMAHRGISTAFKGGKEGGASRA